MINTKSKKKYLNEEETIKAINKKIDAHDEEIKYLVQREIDDHKQYSWVHNSWNVLLISLWIGLVIFWSFTLYHDIYGIGSANWQPINCVNETKLITFVEWPDNHIAVFSDCHTRTWVFGSEYTHQEVKVYCQYIPTGRQICSQKTPVKNEMSVIG